MQSYNEEKKRPVNQYDLDGNFIKQYESLTEAGKPYGNTSTIWRACIQHVDEKGCHTYTAYGYQWRYADDCDDIGKYIRPKSKRAKGGNAHNAVKINQYDKNGKYIKTWECIKDAADFYNINVSTIVGALNESKNKNAKGFQWRRYEDYSDCSDIARYERNHNYDYCMKRVGQYDINGNLLKIYNSGKEASIETNVSQTCISSCCKGKTRTAGGYIWKYAS